MMTELSQQYHSKWTCMHACNAIMHSCQLLRPVNLAVMLHFLFAYDDDLVDANFDISQEEQDILV